MNPTNADSPICILAPNFASARYAARLWGLDSAASFWGDGPETIRGRIPGRVAVAQVLWWPYSSAILEEMVARGWSNITKLMPDPKAPDMGTALKLATS